MDSDRDARIEMLRGELLGGPLRSQASANAVLELAILMAAADGDVSDREAEQIVDIVHRLAGGPFDVTGLRGVVSVTRERLSREGAERRIDAAAAAIRDPAERLQAFRIVAAVALVDRWLDRAELRLFNSLARAFAIPPDESGRIVTEIRQQLFPSEE
jgi:hypothetical protein